MNLTLRSREPFSTRLVNTGELTRAPDITSGDLLVELAGQDVYKTIVELDLAETRFINSSGLGWLLITHKRCTENGGRFVMHSLPPPIRQLIGVLKLDRVLCIVESEDDVPVFVA